MTTTTLQTVEGWASLAGTLLTALGKAGGANTTTSTTPSVTATVGVDIFPTITAIATAVGEVIKIADLVFGAKNTPEFLASVAAQQRVDKIDEINEALKNGDLDELRRLSSL